MDRMGTSDKRCIPRWQTLLKTDGDWTLQTAKGKWLLVPAYDGTTWYLFAGEKAEIVWENTTLRSYKVITVLFVEHGQGSPNL